MGDASQSTKTALDHQPTGRKALFLVPATLAALEEKGVASMILERDESGYFGHVYTAHYPAPENRLVCLTERHTVIEVAPDLPSSCSRVPQWSWLARGLRLCSTLRFLWRMRRLIQEERITLIRATEPYHRGLWAFLLSAVTGVPWCVSLHADYDKRIELDPGLGAPRVFGSRTLARRLERFVLRRAPLVLPIRDSLGAYARRHGARPESIRVIPHGISMELFAGTPPSDVKAQFDFQNKKVITSVGRLSRQNYVFDIVEVAQRVVAARPDTMFLMVGDGGERGALERSVRERGLKDHVIFLGFLSRDQVGALRVVSDVNLCLMGGFSLIEAAAAGRPIVAYDVEWHRELVQDGETGFLVPEHDVEAASRAIHRLLEDEGLAGRLGRAARELAIRRHSREATSREKVRAYDELIGTVVAAGKAKGHSEGAKQADR